MEPTVVLLLGHRSEASVLVEASLYREALNVVIKDGR